MRPEHNAEYISKIRMRLCDDALARKEREKRRRRVLVEQLGAHEAIEQRKHEDMLVTCLMRQSQLERRIALQLLQVRLEKDVIRNNRLQREQQYMQRRLQDFDEALNHEAEVARLTKLEYEEQCAKELTRHENIAAENESAKYMKHYNMCKDTLMQMVDLASTAGHYKDVSEQPIPIHLWREWQALFVAGKPFFEDKTKCEGSEEEDCEAVTVLNDCNMGQYKSLAGEWVPPEEHPEITPHLPCQNNFILGHILKRLEVIVYPPPKPSTPPQFPEFPIKACVVGKTFSGKTSLLTALCAKKRLKILDVDVLIEEAVSAFNSNETVEVVEIVDSAMTPSGDEVSATSDGAPPEGEVAAPPTETPAPVEQAAEVPPDETGAISPGATLHSITKQVPSPRAILGKAVEQAMTKGKSVPINIMTDVVVLGIREVPEGTGWILDNFPKTLKQAKVLEKALSGYSKSESRASVLSTPSALTPRSTPVGTTPRSTPSPSSKLAAKTGAKKGKKNQLVDEPDSDKPPPPPQPMSGLDLVIHLSIPDKVAIKRACGRRLHKDGEEYHEELRPPPEGSYTGVPPTYDEFNVKHSPSPETEPIEDDAYRQIQPRLVTHQEEWARMEKWFTMFNNLVTVDAQSPLCEVEEEVEVLLEDTLAKKNKTPTPLPVETPFEEEKPAETPDKPAEVTPAPEEISTPAPVTETASQDGVPETIPEESPQSPSPVPGSDEWTYVDEPIPQEAAHVLFPQWELVQNSYLQLCKHTFKKIRGERETIVRYFFSTKKNFLVFLQRPDNKQTFVTSWLKNYNNVAEDMREDYELKAELHQTVEDLQEKLWDISDKKKIEAEEERQNIITEQWLEDNIGILTNHYIQLLQAEVDRYQGSVRLIKDYYQVLEAKTLDEPKKDFIRVPLVELPRTDSPQPPSEEKNERSSARSERSKSAGKVQASPSMQTPGVPATESEENGDAEPQRRIPLVSRKVQERESRKSGKPPRETPEQDSEEAQIIEAYMSALAVIEQLKQPSQEEDAGADGKGKAKGKDKGKPKKGKKSASPAVTPNAGGTPVPELTPEEITRLKMLEQANMECAAALLCEEKSLNLKLAVVKLRAITVIKELKERAAKMYEVQYEWIGQRFQKEMDSIKTMCELLSDVIESEKPLLPQVLLCDEKFEVDMGYKMFEPPLTPQPEAPIEIPTPDIFTIEQLHDLHTNMKEIAPSGYISLDLLVEMFEPPSFLPEIWQNVTIQQLEEIFSIHLCETKYINWRTVLLSCVLPLPLPTQHELISAASQYGSMDKEGRGVLDVSEYARADLWFSGGGLMTPDGTCQFDRLGHLKTTIFSLFCEDNYSIDYTDFLLLFSADPEPGNGVLKALSVMTGMEVEWPSYIETPDPSKDVESNPSTTGAAIGVPTKHIPITLDQLLRVISFNRMPTKSLKLVQEEMTTVFKEMEGEDGKADVSTLLVHPKGRDIILHTPSYLLVDYRTLLHNAVGQDPKFSERVPQPLV